MFSTLPAHKHYQNSMITSYTPYIPSPLSSSPVQHPCSPSATTNDSYSRPLREQQANFMEISSPSKPERKPSKDSSFATNDPPSADKQITHVYGIITPPNSKCQSKFSRRPTKPNPLMNLGSVSSDEGKETRRKLFLKRVRDGSEEKKWQRRNLGMTEGDQEALRSLWIWEEKKWAEKLRREAVSLDFDVEIEDMPEKVMREEKFAHAELEMLLEQEILHIPDTHGIWEDAPTDHSIRTEAENQEIYGSDDEEYDHIFREVIEHERRPTTTEPSSQGGNDEDMMDLS